MDDNTITGNRTTQTSGQQGYVDLYLLPVPTSELAIYKDQATEFGEVLLEMGGLSYREFTGEDLGNSDGGMSFTQAVTVKDGETLTAAIAEFNSRQHRDEVMAKVMADPRIKAMEKEEPLADMDRMHYGGFQLFVNPGK